MPQAVPVEILGVALRKESVDRNCAALVVVPNSAASLSARRAWIEILRLEFLYKFFIVALRKESVDRNVLIGCPKYR